MSKGTARARGRPPYRTPIGRVVGNYRRSNKGIVSKVVREQVRCDFLSNGVSEMPPIVTSGTTSHTLTEPHWTQQRDRVGRGLVSNLPPFPHARLHNRPCQRHSQPTMSITQAGRLDEARCNKIWGRIKRIFVKRPEIGSHASDARGWSQ